ncbi:hypothetical protein SR41_11040 [Sphingomonas melonis]|uniref:Primase C-terminal 1 domain-containing protein n=1 Tax=Sphingomonas melonis TaxID=152682 RepID=A0A0D1M5C3_9SPHN|nr:hypothetical protein [Sphingomonas melonis]KIU27220.1 hypothetical protein SR41_11040 [Sphingomonas melonis]
MIVTLFDHTRDNLGHQWEVEPAVFLSTLIAAPSRLDRVRKFDATAFCGCYFDGTRAKANARDLAMVALDVDDGGADWFDALYELSDLGVAFALYTTTKHRRSHNRYRIVLPLARPVGIDEYDALWGALARYFAARGIIIDKATSDISRMSIASHIWTGDDDKGGRYTPDDDDAQRAVAQPDWPLLDPDAMIAAYPAPAAAPTFERSPCAGDDYRRWQNWHVARDVLSDLDISPIVPRARLDAEMSSRDTGRTFRFLCGCALKGVSGGYDMDESVLMSLGLEFSRRVGRKPDGLARDVRNALLRARAAA